MIANIKLPDDWDKNKCNVCPFSSFIHEWGAPDHYKCFLGYGELIVGAETKYFHDIKPHCKLEVKKDEI